MTIKELLDVLTEKTNLIFVYTFCGKSFSHNTNVKSLKGESGDFMNQKINKASHGPNAVVIYIN